MDELVKKMLDPWFTFNDGNVEDQHARMTAAAKVLLEAALGDLTPEEWEAGKLTVIDCGRHIEVMHRDIINRELKKRKARLLAPKTIEERVEVVASTNGGWAVLVDGKQVFWQSMKEHAETFRRGLIAEMKEKG